MSHDFQSFTEFYPYYLGQHGRRGTRLLHFVGTAAAVFLVAASAITLTG